MTSVHDDFPGENKTHIGGVSFFSSIMVRDCWGFYFSSIQLKHFFDVVPKIDVMVCLYICSFSSPSHRSVQFNPALLDAPQLVRLLRTGRVMLVRTFVKFISFLPALFDASANRFRVSRSDTQRQPIIISTGREMCVTVCHSRCVVLFCCCLVFSCLDNFSNEFSLGMPPPPTCSHTPHLLLSLL